MRECVNWIRLHIVLLCVPTTHNNTTDTRTSSTSHIIPNPPVPPVCSSQIMSAHQIRVPTVLVLLLAQFAQLSRGGIVASNDLRHAAAIASLNDIPHSDVHVVPSTVRTKSTAEDDGSDSAAYVLQETWDVDNSAGNCRQWNRQTNSHLSYSYL